MGYIFFLIHHLFSLFNGVGGLKCLESLHNLMPSIITQGGSSKQQMCGGLLASKVISQLVMKLSLSHIPHWLLRFPSHRQSCVGFYLHDPLV